MARKRTRAQNQAQHWEQRQVLAREDGPQAVASVWFDAARMVAKQRALGGEMEVWEELAKALRDFYQRYSQ
ncbi:hypothetical protein GCM10023347_07680 [Streptomyces chumphonensis]|uniref:Uncharacterized protein n=1 Tax=Streptomyces chumphonensis TaxID=1214925 RepID=A0A927F4W9_9ACTN|nr:hypothetical protein [Streptomyces chumphonensis]MBD3934842.1 hypothetical protein [Streptomyces chumphonensis]